MFYRTFSQLFLIAGFFSPIASRDFSIAGQRVHFSLAGRLRFHRQWRDKRFPFFAGVLMSRIFCADE